MTSEATAGQIPDVYGQVHPVETPELLESKKVELEQELDLIPPEEKTDWLEAQAKCDFVGDDFKLKFLRCEVFNADVSASVELLSHDAIVLIVLAFSSPPSA